MRKQFVAETEALTTEDVDDLKKIYEREARNPYSKKITKQYLKTLMGEKKVLKSDELPLNSKEDLLLALSAVAYAKENGFFVEQEDGYFEMGNMILKSFRIYEV